MLDPPTQVCTAHNFTEPPRVCNSLRSELPCGYVHGGHLNARATSQHAKFVTNKEDETMAFNSIPYVISVMLRHAVLETGKSASVTNNRAH